MNVNLLNLSKLEMKKKDINDILSTILCGFCYEIRFRNVDNP